MDLLKQEGVVFKASVDVGVDITADQIKSDFDAVVICVGATAPRDLKIPGRTLSGVHFAMDYLRGATSSLLSENDFDIDAKDKNVVVIGGGDTGNDCIGTAIRQGCKSVTNLEIVTEPPESRAASNPWPQWPLIYRTDYGHAEAAAKFGDDPRMFAVETVEFLGDVEWNLTGLKTIQVDWTVQRPGVAPFSQIEGTEKIIEADLVFLALGFLGPAPGLIEDFGLQTDQRSNISANMTDFETSVPGVFAAGDCRRGQSLIVWAIREGRDAAEACHDYLLAVDV